MAGGWGLKVHLLRIGSGGLALHPQLMANVLPEGQQPGLDFELGSVGMKLRLSTGSLPKKFFCLLGRTESGIDINQPHDAHHLLVSQTQGHLVPDPFRV